MAYGLLLIRVVFGLTMAADGAQKLLGWFGGPGLEGTAGMLGKLRFHLAGPMAVLVALAELSGVLFAAGLVTPLAALGIATVMLTAIATVHWKNGFFAGKAATSSTSAFSPLPSASPRPAPAASPSTA